MQERLKKDESEGENDAKKMKSEQRKRAYLMLEATEGPTTRGVRALVRS
jgi:hypothetical protein